MNLDYKIPDTSRLSFEGNFDAQVEHIMQTVRLSRSEVQNLRHLFEDLEEELQKFVYGCTVVPFGSIVSGLGIKTSDVDCFVMLPGDMKPTNHTVHIVKSILQRNGRKFTELFSISRCNVPIVKFLHRPTNCFCDVSFKSPAGVRNSELIAYLLNKDKRGIPLAVLIKYWSKVYKFTGTNLMPSYALTLLVIFYLQIKNILPSVYVLQNNTYSFMVDNWETAFNEEMPYKTVNDESFYQLLGGFFKYYSNFDFNNNIISPFVGRVLSRNEFENINCLSPEFYLYKANVSKELCKEWKVGSAMCVQDPFDHSRNCTQVVYPRLLSRVVSYFQFAAKYFDEKVDHAFLKAIYTEMPIPNDTNKSKHKHVFHNKINKNKGKSRQVLPARLNVKNMYMETKRNKRWRYT